MNQENMNQSTNNVPVNNNVNNTMNPNGVEQQVITPAVEPQIVEPTPKEQPRIVATTPIEQIQPIEQQQPVMQTTSVEQHQVVATPPTDQPQVAAPTTQTEQQSKKEHKKNNKLIIGIIAAAIVLVIIIIVAISSFFGKDGLNLKLPSLGEKKEHQFINIYETDDNTKYYVDENSKLHTFSGYFSLDDFSNGYAVFSKRTEKSGIVYGVINEKEKEVIKAGTYSKISRATSNCNYFIVEDDDYVGVVNEKGKTIIPIEYDDIRGISYSGTNKCLFIVEKDEKFHYASTNGTIFLETEEPSYWGGDTRVLENLNDEYVGIVEIDEKYYNTETGEKLNIKLTDNYHKFIYNIYVTSNGYQIYGKDGKVKEEYNFQDISNVKVNITKTNHVVVTGSAHIDDRYISFYRIYDMDYNFIKGEEVSDVYEIIFKEVNDKYFYLTFDTRGTKAKTKKIILFDSKLKETVKESAIAGNIYETRDGELIYTESEYKKKYEAFTLEGEKLFTLEKNYGSYFAGELFTLYDMNNYSKYSVYNLKGEQLAKGFDNVRKVHKNFMVGYNYNGKETLVLPNGKTIFMENYEWSVCGELPSAYNKKDKNYKLYDLEGNLILEQKIKESECVGDKYKILVGEEKAVVYKTEDYKPIFEFDADKYLYSMNYYDRGVEIMDLKDGFYTFDGKLILAKEEQ